MQRRAALSGAAIREYAAGSLWVVPAVCSVLALVLGLLLSLVHVPQGSPFAPFVFEGTADDARTLLIAIASTVVTVSAIVIALVKVRIIFREFMEVRHAPVLLRRLTDGWVVLMAVCLLGSYFIGSMVA